MSTKANELIAEFSKGQSQFAYFQLGIAASAIAFAIHETNGKSLADTPVLTGAAVALWAFSFAFGCFGLGARLRGINSNARYLRMEILAVGLAGQIQQDLKDAQADADRDVKKPVKWFGAQMWVLFLGALAFIGGHIQQMANTPSSSPTVATTKN